MPIKHAALKQLRKDRKRAVRNQAFFSELKTLKKKFRSLLDEKKPDEARQLLPLVMRRFDRAASKGIIHKRVVQRVKSRFSRALPASSKK